MPMINLTGAYTDQYQLSMALVYFRMGNGNDQAIFDYFFRKLPFEGGYAIFAGLEDLLDTIENLNFDQKDLEFLDQNGFPGDFLELLGNFNFSGKIFSSREGDIVFPTRPVLRVEGSLLEAQIIETLLLNLLNFQTLIATRASRMRMVAGDRKLVDFGLRRAQGVGGYHASRAALIGGFDATSNVAAGRDFQLPVSGTMAHSYIQSFENEVDAFREFARVHPKNCVLLVDTYDTLRIGIPNAIQVGKEMKARGEQLKGIRLDSGDLAFLALRCREMLDEAGLNDVKIAASNQLDEYVIKSLLEQAAPIDIFGVGTSLVTGQPDAALDGVYKLAYAHGKPRIKISENIAKTTLPDRKQVYRLKDDVGNWIGADLVALEEEKDFGMMHHPFDPGKKMQISDVDMEPLLEKVMEDGHRVYEKTLPLEIADYSRSQLDKLPGAYKRFRNPHIYKVGISDGLKKLRESLSAKNE